MRIDFFAPIANAVDRPRAELRCLLAPSAILPQSFRLLHVDRHVSAGWSKAVQSGNTFEAGRKFLVSCAVNDDRTPGQIAAGCVQASQLLLCHGDISAADRCLQESLARLAVSYGPSTANYDVQRWLVLSSVALAKKDAETSEMWLRQASRALTSRSSELTSHMLNHFLGDLLALRACLRFSTDDATTSAACLMEAHRAHKEACSHLSCALDLLLLSRCLANNNDLPSARDALVQAAESIEVQAGPSQDDSAFIIQRLQQAISQEQSLLDQQSEHVQPCWN